MLSRRSEKHSEQPPTGNIRSLGPRARHRVEAQYSFAETNKQKKVKKRINYIMVWEKLKYEELGLLIFSSVFPHCTHTPFSPNLRFFRDFVPYRDICVSFFVLFFLVF